MQIKDPSGKSKDESVYHFSNDLVDFTFYKSPKVVKIEPTSGLSTGGTALEVSGLWFDLKPAYGIIP